LYPHYSNGLVEYYIKEYRLTFRRLEMGTVIIDIDKLLEATSNLTSEKSNNKIKKVEIDLLLENTRDW
jgi:hypothetical protein